MCLVYKNKNPTRRRPRLLSFPLIDVVLPPPHALSPFPYSFGDFLALFSLRSPDCVILSRPPRADSLKPIKLTTSRLHFFIPPSPFLPQGLLPLPHFFSPTIGTMSLVPCVPPRCYFWCHLVLLGGSHLRLGVGLGTLGGPRAPLGPSHREGSSLGRARGGSAGRDVPPGAGQDPRDRAPCARIGPRVPGSGPAKPPSLRFLGASRHPAALSGAVCALGALRQAEGGGDAMSFYDAFRGFFGFPGRGR